MVATNITEYFQVKKKITPLLYIMPSLLGILFPLAFYMVLTVKLRLYIMSLHCIIEIL